MIPVNEPKLGPRELEYVTECVQTGWISSAGRFIDQFEAQGGKSGVIALLEVPPGQETDVFVLLTAKEQLNTREGKPYFRVGFRDGTREVSFPIWADSPWAIDCREAWNPGDRRRWCQGIG